jgi:DNA-binding IclR family transcriptional regulator
MKEYRLSAWPELGATYDRMAFRRMLTEMSQRHMTLPSLVARSGLARREVRRFVQMLGARGLLSERMSSNKDSVFGALVPLGHWLRKTR